jgi:hypothetical protein
VTNRTKRFLGAALFSSLLFLGIGSLLVSYKVGVTLLLGLAGSVVVIGLLDYAGVVWSAARLLKLIIDLSAIGLGVIGLLILVAITLSLFFLKSCGPSTHPSPPNAIEEYRATIRQNDPNLESFRVKEEIKVSIKRVLEGGGRGESPRTLSELMEDKIDQTQNKHVIDASELTEDELIISFDERTITSSKKGFFLREAEFAPLNVDSDGYIDIPLRAGMLKHIKMCAFGCPDSKISLIDLPDDVFYEARYSDDLKKSHYTDTETVTWTMRFLDPGITFSYVPPPYQHVRSVLRPFLGLSSFGQWLVGLIAFIVPVVCAYMIGPVLAEAAKRPFTKIAVIVHQWFVKRRRRAKRSRTRKKRGES